MMMMIMPLPSSLHLAVVLSLLPTLALGQQPKIVDIDTKPAKRSWGINVLAQGSVWCDGKPTVWLPGHKDILEDRPSCQKKTGKWRKSKTTVMDVNDELNIFDRDYRIDRHGCGILDINRDGLPDIYCGVGAARGTAYGYTELYRTRKDGSLKKVLRNGLQKFLGQRTRLTTTLDSVNNTKLVFITASFGRREDGKQNKHAMFRTNYANDDKWWRRYFRHVNGFWQKHTDASCAITVDANSDGLGDLLLCNPGEPADLWVQKANGEFFPSPLTKFNNQRNWRNARTGDVNGDGIPDLAVVYNGKKNSYLRVFRGLGRHPYYDFKDVYYQTPLPFAAPDLDFVDANRDGALDIYIVQNDERTKESDGSKRSKTYCAGIHRYPDWFTGPTTIHTPNRTWIPPKDRAPDILLRGNPGAAKSNKRFRVVQMRHSEPGCGYFVKAFDKHSLVLAQGGPERHGHQLLLEW